MLPNSNNPYSYGLNAYNAYSPLNNTQNGVNTLIPSLNQFNPQQRTSSLCLNQIDGFEPTPRFTDNTNTEWSLVKSAFDSTVDIPDPKSMQIVDYWNHEFPGLKTKIYVYVVEGIRQPRVETEQPTRILYQWFSTVFIPTFTPAMIMDKEWLKANVYAAPVINARVAKLKSLCKLKDDVAAAPTEEGKLLHVDELMKILEGGQNGQPAERDPQTD